MNSNFDNDKQAIEQGLLFIIVIVTECLDELKN